MRLASFPLPTVNNDGVDQSETHAALQLALCADFGGFTCTLGQGGWIADTGKIYVDPVAVYTIAMEDSYVARAKLESIALFYGDIAGQIAVMVTHANGEVAFLDVAPVMSKARELT